MAHNNPPQYLFLHRDDDKNEALKTFVGFVGNTGGNLTDDRDFFHQWEKFPFGSNEVGVLFTRISHGTAKVMKAHVVGITKELTSGTYIPPPLGH